MFSTPDLPFIKMGFLYKRARKSGRNWRKRWIVANLQRGVLSYYKTRKEHESHKKPKGTVQLPKPFFTYIERSTEKGRHVKEHAFEIYSINPGTGSRSDIFHLAAENEADMNMWIETLQSVCRGGEQDRIEKKALASKPPDSLSQSSSQNIAKHKETGVQDRRRTQILRRAGRKRMSVGMVVGLPAEATKDVQRVHVVGAGHVSCNGEYRAIRTPPNGSLSVAFANNQGYRLVLRDRQAQPSVWEILHAAGRNDVLYASDNIYGHLPPVNQWRVVMGESPAPALEEVNLEPLNENIENDEIDDAQEEKISPEFVNTSSRQPSKIVVNTHTQLIEAPTVFSPTFFTSKLYEYTPAVDFGTIPKTPRGGVPYSALAGPYLNDQLKSLCPPKPFRPPPGRPPAEHEEMRQLPPPPLRAMPPPPLAGPPTIPGPPTSAAWEAAIAASDDSESDISDDDRAALNKELDLLYPVTKEQKEEAARHRLKEEKIGRLSVIPGPPMSAPPRTPGPPSKLPIPPPFEGGNSVSLPGPPSSLPGPPSSLPGPPSSLPGPPQRKRASLNSTAPAMRSSLPAAPSEELSAPFQRGSGQGSSKRAKTGAKLSSPPLPPPPPQIPSAPLFIPGAKNGSMYSQKKPSFEKKNIRTKRQSQRRSGPPPSVPAAPSYIPNMSLSPKRTRSFRGNVLKSKGSMHTLRKDHFGEDDAAHVRHRPPAMRLHGQ